MFGGHYTGIGAAERAQLLRRWKQVFWGQRAARQWMLPRQIRDFTDNADFFGWTFLWNWSEIFHAKALRRKEYEVIYHKVHKDHEAGRKNK
jgi:hypothetical protein